MTIISSEAGLFGPFDRIENLGDRLRAWVQGAPAEALGADLPLCVIGAYELLEVEAPPGFIAADYSWNGVSLMLKLSAPAISTPSEPDNQSPQTSLLTRLFSKS